MKKFNWFGIAIIAGIIFLALISGCISQATYEKTKKPVEITLRIKRDLTNEDALKRDACQLYTERYHNSKEFSDKGFSKCTLIEDKIGIGFKDCPNGDGPMCKVCILQCN